MPVPIVGEIGVVEQSPQLKFTDAGLDGLLQLGNTVLGDGNGPADTVDLILGLDYPGRLAHQNTINHLKAAALQSSGNAGIHIFDRNPAVISTDLGQVIYNITRQLFRVLTENISTVKKRNRPARPGFIGPGHACHHTVNYRRAICRKKNISLWHM